MKTLRQHGFTIVEMVIVLVVLAICMAIAIPWLIRQRDQRYMDLAATTPGIVFELRAESTEDQFPDSDPIILRCEIRNPGPVDLPLVLCAESSFRVLKGSNVVAAPTQFRLGAESRWSTWDYSSNLGTLEVIIPSRESLHVKVRARRTGPQSIGEEEWVLQIEQGACRGGAGWMTRLPIPDGYYIISNPIGFDVVAVAADAEPDYQKLLAHQPNRVLDINCVPLEVPVRLDENVFIECGILNTSPVALDFSWFKVMLQSDGITGRIYTTTAKVLTPSDTRLRLNPGEEAFIRLELHQLYSRLVLPDFTIQQTRFLSRYWEWHVEIFQDALEDTDWRGRAYLRSNSFSIDLIEESTTETSPQ